MKKLLLLLITLVLLAGITAGCGSKVLTYIDPTETITISVDGQFRIALDRVAGEGFVWVITYDRAFLKLTEESYDSQVKEEGLTGKGGTQYYRFKGLKAGSTEIDLDYKRPRDDIPTREMTFKITIE